MNDDEINISKENEYLIDYYIMGEEETGEEESSMMNEYTIDDDVGEEESMINEYTIDDNVGEEESFVMNEYMINDNNADYTLHFPEQISEELELDVRLNIQNYKLTKFPDKAYGEFMELISKHHISNSAGDDILKWFHTNHMREDAKIPKNTMQGRAFVDS